MPALLDLSRADLVQAMDPDDVRLSEVTYLQRCLPLHPDWIRKALTPNEP